MAHFISIRHLHAVFSSTARPVSTRSARARSSAATTSSSIRKRASIDHRHRPRERLRRSGPLQPHLPRPLRRSPAACVPRHPDAPRRQVHAATGARGDGASRRQRTCAQRQTSGVRLRRSSDDLIEEDAMSRPPHRPARRDHRARERGSCRFRMPRPARRSATRPCTGRRPGCRGGGRRAAQPAWTPSATKSGRRS